MNTRRLALCAVLCALGDAFLWVGSVLDLFDLTLACAASLISMFAVIELRGSAPWMIYAVTGILALIIVPVKLTALEYLLFSGCYPMLKYWLERRLHSRALCWAVKVGYAGVIMTALLLLSRLFVPDAEPIWLIAASVAVGMTAFVLYDILLTRLTVLYFRSLRDRLRIERLLK